MLQKKVIIINKLGLHARAAAKFVTMASVFECDIKVSKGDRVVNGKSIMAVMMLAAAQGTEIELATDGPDEAKAMELLEELIAKRFGEFE